MPKIRTAVDEWRDQGYPGASEVTRRLFEYWFDEANAVETLLGKKPSQDLAASGQRSMLERVKSLKELVVLNDEAHHVHDEDLPEQVIGRGLRLMTQIGPDRTQTLEVLGTRNLLNVLRDQLEAEGVGVATTEKKDPPLPVIIAPIQERLAYDITLPDHQTEVGARHPQAGGPES